jgi:ferritin-like metal-binding protein YciE
MTNSTDHLSDWLRDAHAMEEQALTMMESQIARLENYPELRDRLKRHIEETRGQARRLESCIERLGTSTSAFKDIAAKTVATFQGLSGLFVNDEVVKGHLASYVFEHFEIASYRMLIAAAEEAGDTETRRACEENLREEEAMAAWLADNAAATTKRFMQRDLADVEAKH